MPLRTAPRSLWRLSADVLLGAALWAPVATLGYLTGFSSHAGSWSPWVCGAMGAVLFAAASVQGFSASAAIGPRSLAGPPPPTGWWRWPMLLPAAALWVCAGAGIGAALLAWPPLTELAGVIALFVICGTTVARLATFPAATAHDRVAERHGPALAWLDGVVGGLFWIVPALPLFGLAALLGFLLMWGQQMGAAMTVMTVPALITFVVMFFGGRAFFRASRRGISMLGWTFGAPDRDFVPPADLRSVLLRLAIGPVFTWLAAAFFATALSRPQVKPLAPKDAALIVGYRMIAWSLLVAVPWMLFRLWTAPKRVIPGPPEQGTRQ